MIACVNLPLDDGLILGLQGRAIDRAIGFAHAPPARARAADALVRYTGEGHLMTIGATGSSKTAGPAICNALTHPGQLVSLECKGDIHAATAAQRRRMGQEVHLIDLRGLDPVSASFNPIDAFKRCGGDISVLARSIAAALVPRGSKEDFFWVNWAETMITAGLALKLETAPPEQHNFSAQFDLFNSDNVAYALAAELDRNPRLGRAARAGLVGFIELPDRETRPSVLASTQQHLRLWESDLIRKLTDTTSFDLDAFLAGEPMSIYFVVPPLRLHAYAPILRLWLSALMSALLTRTERPPHRTLMLCDELGALGNFDAFVTASTLMRSSGLQLWSFWQNLSQLEVYGAHARTLVDNLGVLQLLGARNHRMATEFATLAGGITADEIMALAEDECVALVDGHRLERLRRIRYFEHEGLKALTPDRGNGALEGCVAAAGSTR